MTLPNPKDSKGAAYVVVIGMAAAMVALAASVFFPSIIPARAVTTKL